MRSTAILLLGSAPLLAQSSFRWEGLVDAYHGYNTNRPPAGFNAIRAYDTRHNQPTLNMARLTLEGQKGEFGFRFDGGAGRGFELFNAVDPSRHFLTRHLFQAYASYKPARLGGVQFDLGRFFTAAGAEVTESHLNWNYSRSLLFTWAEPYYHTGFRASMPLTKSFTVGAQLVHGWNSTRDNNGAKTMGFTGTWTAGRLTWSNAFYTGAEKTGITRGYRHFYDTVVLVKVNSRVDAYTSFDYGREARLDGTADQWGGFAGAMKVALTKRWAFAPRVEWYRDATGFTTGTAQTLKEATATALYDAGHGVQARLEYRSDWSSAPFFETAGESRNRQGTVTAALMWTFGAKR